MNVKNYFKLRLGRMSLFKLGILLIVLYIGLNRMNVLTNTVKGMGEVTSYQLNYSAPVAMRPEVRFVSQDGKQVRFAGGDGNLFEIGDKVPVLFKKNDPSEAWIYTFSSFWYPAILWGLFPLLLLTAAVFSFVKKDEVIVMDVLKKFSIKKIKVNEDMSLPG